MIRSTTAGALPTISAKGVAHKAEKTETHKPPPKYDGDTKVRRPLGRLLTMIFTPYGKPLDIYLWSLDKGRSIIF